MTTYEEKKEPNLISKAMISSNRYISQRELNYKEKLKGILNEYKNCLIISKENVSSSQFGTLRKELGGRARFLMGRNYVIRQTIRQYIDETNRNELEQLLPYIRGQCGLVFTNETNIASLRRDIESNKQQSTAKRNQIAPEDVFIPQGTTGLDPTQCSGFAPLGICTRIMRGLIYIEEKVHLIKKADRITASEAAMLTKLRIKPFTFGVKVLYIFQDGILFDAKLMDWADDNLQMSFCNAIQQIAGLTTELNHYIDINVLFSILNAYKNVLALGLNFDGYSWQGLDAMRHIIQSCENKSSEKLLAEIEEEKTSSSSSKPYVGLFGDESSDEEDHSLQGIVDID